MTDDYAIEGEDGGYVPCFELPAPLVVEEEGAIYGVAGGRVPRDNAAAALPPPEREAIVGSGTGFVAKPCEEPCVGVPATLRANWINDVGYLGQSDPVFGPPLYGQWTQCNADDREWRTYCAIAEVTDSEKAATIDLGLVTGMSLEYAGMINPWAGASVAWELRGGIWDQAADGNLPFDLPGYTVLASGDEAEDTFVNFFVNNGDCTAGAGQTAYRTVPTLSFTIPTLINDQQYWVYLVATSTETGYYNEVVGPPGFGFSSIESRGDTSKQLTSWVSASLANHVGEINSIYTLCGEPLVGSARRIFDTAPSPDEPDGSTATIHSNNVVYAMWFDNDTGAALPGYNSDQRIAISYELPVGVGHVHVQGTIYGNNQPTVNVPPGPPVEFKWELYRGSWEVSDFTWDPTGLTLISAGSVIADSVTDVELIAIDQTFAVVDPFFSLYLINVSEDGTYNNDQVVLGDNTAVVSPRGSAFIDNGSRIFFGVFARPMPDDLVVSGST